ncbi:Late embryogenesis abundant protein, LEA-14 [Corchorus capsularis]|uniref:Late embryogenesis abundant protein, LEA-14 n=1 Tax=Corchorus capsularis TaxID=210143 RepID=A0A1R3H245_COCAP|nr:Late embryogenesis abundant protein, LEA-14 [Corchorus capsularis]
MVEGDQARPLAPASDQLGSDEEEAALHIKKLRRKKCIKCCACISALLIIQAVVIIILIFTVFRVKDPVIKLNGFTITKLELINGTTPKPGSNISLIADVSVKNPNLASFKYTNTSTTLYYYGTVVGEARGPAGRAKARRTMRMNISVDMITDQILASPNLSGDLSSGTLTMSSYSRIGGRVNIINIIKKHVTVKMNCSMTVNISSQAIQQQKCKRKVDL